MNQRTLRVASDLMAATLSVVGAWLWMRPHAGYGWVDESAWIRLAAVGAALAPALRLARLGITPWIGPVLLAAQVPLVERVVSGAFFQPSLAAALPLLAPALACLVIGAVAAVSWLSRVRSSGLDRGDRCDLAAVVLAAAAACWWSAQWTDLPSLRLPYAYADTWAVGCGISTGGAMAAIVPGLRLARSQGARDVAIWCVPLSVVWLSPWRWLDVFGTPGRLSMIWSNPDWRAHFILGSAPYISILVVLVAVELVAAATGLGVWPRPESDEI